MGVAKVFWCLFVPFKAGAKFFQYVAVRLNSGVLKVFKIERQAERNLIARGRQRFSGAFLCFLKLEAKFFQCVAVRTSSGHLRSLN
jgi:hypothetical protein